MEVATLNLSLLLWLFIAGAGSDVSEEDEVRDFLASIFHLYMLVYQTYFKTPKCDQSTVLHLSEQSW